MSGVVQYTIDNFESFDAWCGIKGVDPLELPAYRFYNLALASLKEGLEGEKLVEFENNLAKFDVFDHPWVGRKKKTYQVVGKKTETKAQPVSSSVVIDEEEEAARIVGKKVAGATGGEVEAQIPSWWRGDKANYAIASRVAGQAQGLKA